MKEGYFPLTSIAATVTCWGRQLITGETKRRIEEKGYRVIYGDTDSVMVVLTGMTMEEAWATGIELASFISNDVLGQFPSLTILPEKVAKLFLMLKKKNYVAIISTNPNKPHDVVLDYKGIEMKRRDKTRFVKEMLGAIVDIMMPLAAAVDCRPETTAPAISAAVRDWLTKVVNDELGVEYYEASKTAKIEYKGSRPGHMLVMDRHNARIDSGEQRGVMWDAGKRVPYVVLVGKRQGEVVQWGQGDVTPRMEEPEWFAVWNSTPHRRKADKMVIDRVYYLALCENAVVRLLPYHLPSVAEMFAFARTRVVQQLTRSGSIADHMTGARAQMPTGLGQCKKRAAQGKVVAAAPAAPAAPAAAPGGIGAALARAGVLSSLAAARAPVATTLPAGPTTTLAVHPTARAAAPHASRTDTQGAPDALSAPSAAAAAWGRVMTPRASGAMPRPLHRPPRGSPSSTSPAPSSSSSASPASASPASASPRGASAAAGAGDARAAIAGPAAAKQLPSQQEQQLKNRKKQHKASKDKERATGAAAVAGGGGKVTAFFRRV